ncbi:hypothetical protein L798_10332 [Zootermopsis nevadensis]|uniref:Chitin-binding type-2 domain-containing protein n=2 Tax=Zootermopsis nevadensis TaxID=136037 RepID=A0A067R8R3_ZOONE|nr:hypothetical protein L798_10332 [Zootermopsis nevadensis]
MAGSARNETYRAMDRASSVRRLTGPVLGLLLLVASGGDCWPWGSDPFCPPGPEPECPRNPADDTSNYFPHPTDCHYYIQCDGSRKPICRQCGPTIYFSPKVLNCLWPLAAKCEHNATTRQDSLLPPICGPDRRHHLDCDREGNTFRDPSSCDHYYRCTGGTKVRNNCPSGQHYNGLLGACDDPCKAGCKPGANCNQRTTSFRTTSTTSKATSANCIPGVNCPTRSTTTPSCIPGVNCPSRSTTTPKCISGINCPESVTSKCTTGYNCQTTNRCVSDYKCEDEKTPMCFPNRDCDNPRPECPVCNEDGETFAHPLNCDWFYKCEGKVAVPVKCGCGFLYNARYRVCDYPCNVDCTGRAKRATQLKMFCQANASHSSGTMAFSQNSLRSKCGQL